MKIVKEERCLDPVKRHTDCPKPGTLPDVLAANGTVPISLSAPENADQTAMLLQQMLQDCNTDNSSSTPNSTENQCLVNVIGDLLQVMSSDTGDISTDIHASLPNTMEGDQNAFINGQNFMQGNPYSAIANTNYSSVIPARNNAVYMNPNSTGANLVNLQFVTAAPPSTNSAWNRQEMQFLPNFGNYVMNPDQVSFLNNQQAIQGNVLPVYQPYLPLQRQQNRPFSHHQSMSIMARRFSGNFSSVVSGGVPYVMNTDVSNNRMNSSPYSMCAPQSLLTPVMVYPPRTCTVTSSNQTGTPVVTTQLNNDLNSSAWNTLTVNRSAGISPSRASLPFYSVPTTQIMQSQNPRFPNSGTNLSASVSAPNVNAESNIISGVQYSALDVTDTNKPKIIPNLKINSNVSVHNSGIINSGSGDKGFKADPNGEIPVYTAVTSGASCSNYAGTLNQGNLSLDSEALTMGVNSNSFNSQYVEPQSNMQNFDSNNLLFPVTDFLSGEMGCKPMPYSLVSIAPPNSRWMQPLIYPVPRPPVMQPLFNSPNQQPNLQMRHQAPQYWHPQQVPRAPVPPIYVVPPMVGMDMQTTSGGATQSNQHFESQIQAQNGGKGGSSLNGSSNVDLELDLMKQNSSTVDLAPTSEDDVKLQFSTIDVFNLSCDIDQPVVKRKRGRPKGSFGKKKLGAEMLVTPPGGPVLKKPRKRKGLKNSSDSDVIQLDSSQSSIKVSSDSGNYEVFDENIISDDYKTTKRKVSSQMENHIQRNQTYTMQTSAYMDQRLSADKTNPSEVCSHDLGSTISQLKGQMLPDCEVQGVDEEQLFIDILSDGAGSGVDSSLSDNLRVKHSKQQQIRALRAGGTSHEEQVISIPVSSVESIVLDSPSVLELSSSPTVIDLGINESDSDCVVSEIKMNPAIPAEHPVDAAANPSHVNEFEYPNFSHLNFSVSETPMRRSLRSRYDLEGPLRTPKVGMSFQRSTQKATAALMPPLSSVNSGIERQTTQITPQTEVTKSSVTITAARSSQKSTQIFNTPKTPKYDCVPSSKEKDKKYHESLPTNKREISLASFDCQDKIDLTILTEKQPKPFPCEKFISSSDSLTKSANAGCLKYAESRFSTVRWRNTALRTVNRLGRKPAETFDSSINIKKQETIVEICDSPKRECNKSSSMSNVMSKVVAIGRREFQEIMSEESSTEYHEVDTISSLSPESDRSFCVSDTSYMTFDSLNVDLPSKIYLGQMTKTRTQVTKTLTDANNNEIKSKDSVLGTGRSKGREVLSSDVEAHLKSFSIGGRMHCGSRRHRMDILLRKSVFSANQSLSSIHVDNPYWVGRSDSTCSSIASSPLIDDLTGIPLIPLESPENSQNHTTLVYSLSASSPEKPMADSSDDMASIAGSGGGKQPERNPMSVPGNLLECEKCKMRLLSATSKCHCAGGKARVIQRKSLNRNVFEWSRLDLSSSEASPASWNKEQLKKNDTCKYCADKKSRSDSGLLCPSCGAWVPAQPVCGAWVPALLQANNSDGESSVGSSEKSEVLEMANTEFVIVASNEEAKNTLIEPVDKCSQKNENFDILSDGWDTNRELSSMGSLPDYRIAGCRIRSKRNDAEEVNPEMMGWEQAVISRKKLKTPRSGFDIDEDDVRKIREENHHSLVTKRKRGRPRKVTPTTAICTAATRQTPCSKTNSTPRSADKCPSTFPMKDWLRDDIALGNILRSHPDVTNTVTVPLKRIDMLPMSCGRKMNAMTSKRPHSILQDNLSFLESDYTLQSPAECHICKQEVSNYCELQKHWMRDSSCEPIDTMPQTLRSIAARRLVFKSHQLLQKRSIEASHFLKSSGLDSVSTQTPNPMTPVCERKVSDEKTALKSEHFTRAKLLMELNEGRPMTRSRSQESAKTGGRSRSWTKDYETKTPSKGSKDRSYASLSSTPQKTSRLILRLRAVNKTPVKTAASNVKSALIKNTSQSVKKKLYSSNSLKSVKTREKCVLSVDKVWKKSIKEKSEIKPTQNKKSKQKNETKSIKTVIKNKTNVDKNAKKLKKMPNSESVNVKKKLKKNKSNIADIAAEIESVLGLDSYCSVNESSNRNSVVAGCEHPIKEISQSQHSSMVVGTVSKSTKKSLMTSNGVATFSKSKLPAGNKSSKTASKKENIANKSIFVDNLSKEMRMNFAAMKQLQRNTPVSSKISKECAVKEKKNVSEMKTDFPKPTLIEKTASTVFDKSTPKQSGSQEPRNHGTILIQAPTMTTGAVKRIDKKQNAQYYDWDDPGNYSVDLQPNVTFRTVPALNHLPEKPRESKKCCSSGPISSSADNDIDTLKYWCDLCGKGYDQALKLRKHKVTKTHMKLVRIQRMAVSQYIQKQNEASQKKALDSPHSDIVGSTTEGFPRNHVMWPGYPQNHLDQRNVFLQNPHDPPFRFTQLAWDSNVVSSPYTSATPVDQRQSHTSATPVDQRQSHTSATPVAQRQSHQDPQLTSRKPANPDTTWDMWSVLNSPNHSLAFDALTFNLPDELLDTQNTTMNNTTMNTTNYIQLQDVQAAANKNAANGNSPGDVGPLTPTSQWCQMLTQPFDSSTVYSG